jgi:hypothetical protein
MINGQMLELIVHCLADSVCQRKNAIENLPVFARKRITTVCRANTVTPALDSGNNDEKLAEPLFSGWSLDANLNSPSVSTRVSVNLARVQARLTDPVDGKFETECVAEWLKGLWSLLVETPDPETLARLDTQNFRRPRFAVAQAPRTVDVPDFASPEVPQLSQYKIARRTWR